MRDITMEDVFLPFLFIHLNTFGIIDDFFLLVICLKLLHSADIGCRFSPYLLINYIHIVLLIIF